MSYYKHGENNVICDTTGFKRKSGQVVRQWDGYIVSKEYEDIRNPQDFLRGKPDDQSVNISRPRQTDVFLEPGDVTRDDF